MGGRNLFEIHRDRRYKKDVTYKWIGSKRVAIHRPKFKKPSPGMERFWALSTLVLDFSLEHISAAYATGEFWRSTEKEAIRILVETAKLPPFKRFWDEYSSDDFVAFMAGSISVHAEASRKWDYTKEGVKDHLVASYFARQIARYVSLASYHLANTLHTTLC